MKRLLPQLSCRRLARLGHRRRGIDDRRQHLELDAHRSGEILGLGAGRRDAGGDALADIAHLLRGERRIARDLEARHLRDRPHLREPRQIARGEDASAASGGA